MSQAREAELPPVGRGTIALLLVATMGGGIATIVPMAFSLALKLDQLAPGREELLGYVLGVNAVSSLLTSPLAGILSDRTRSRWGRRRPFTVAGMTLGTCAVPLLAFAPNVPVLALGWVLLSLGYGTAAASIGNFTADRLPPQQRGQISGLTAFAMQASPVVGVFATGFVTEHPLWLFLLPSLVGVATMTLFVVLVDEPDSRGMVLDGKLSLGRVVRSYGFRPSRVPDFAWNFAGRFLFFFGLALTTSYTAFFYAQRTGTDVQDVAGIMVLTSLLSMVTALVGAIGGGALSDRLARRRPFMLVSAACYVAGGLVCAFAWELPTLLVGTATMSLGIAVFTSVNQAITLDILPNREAEAGRYMAIVGFSQRIPTAVAPLLAPLLLTLAADGSGKNYSSLYLAASGLALIGGVLIAWRVRGVR